MIILLFGPQGSGKGTQGKLLAEKFGLFYFEAGGFLRSLGKSTRPDIGQRIDKGELIPSPEMFGLVKEYFEEKGITDNIIFDGFPRTIEQYDAIRPWFKSRNMNIDLVFVMKIREEESIMRLTSRRMEPVSGKIYNLITDPPGPEVDRTKLVQREDDQPEAIKLRLALYKSNTEKLIEVLRKETKVIEINGEQPIQVIQAELCEFIKELQK